MVMKMEQFKDRLKFAMNYNKINQVELAEKTNCSKSLISKYLKGETKAKQDRLYMISSVLGVNPVWLMGYDVPMIENKNKNLKDQLKSKIDSLDDSQVEKLLVIIKTMFE